MIVTLDKLLEIHTMYTDERAMIMNDFRYDRVTNLFKAARKRFEFESMLNPLQIKIRDNINEYALYGEVKNK